MNRKRFLCIGCLLLSASLSSGQTRTHVALDSNNGANRDLTPVSNLIIPGEPASIQEATFGTDELFRSGVLTSNSEKPILQYRIGWLATLKDGGNTLGIGEQIKPRQPLRKGVKEEIPRQRVNGTALLGDAKKVQFFVAEVTFADGSRYVLPWPKALEMAHRK